MSSQPSTDPAGESASAQPEKRVTWAELFFDLVFVPIYWAWVGTSIHANTHDVDNPADRFGIFAVGLCALFMALAAPAAFADRGVLFGAAYYGARLLLAISTSPRAP
ncbi:MAG TPA: low temperature requirement protein A [Mycobacteriales bacterium]|nr:low temperature requirement protein A [Mycobacteriales bacterium]